MIYINSQDELDLDILDIIGLSDDKVESLSILSGYNKFGERETFEKIDINAGDIISVVGPTGSGKSRLLADIEWGANGDTPTRRIIQINGKPLDSQKRFSPSFKLVAELSQNMNFVMDLSVREFIELHAKSRLVLNVEEVCEEVFNFANELAGEKFKMETPITSLSGGQSRALMIADTAVLSKSPIILIDEIENAGIDKKKALELLVGKNKIIFISTHDPILGIMADKRLVIKNGGIEKIVISDEKEKKLLNKLEELDEILKICRTKLRNGEKIDIDFKILKKGLISDLILY